MHSTSLPAPAARCSRKQAGAPESASAALSPRKPGRAEALRPASEGEPGTPPAHLNFSFDDWFRLNTEIPRQASGWTPQARLYADYLSFCAATHLPGAYVHPLSEFLERLRRACGRLPEVRKVIDGVREAYQPCWPRFLKRPIRLF